MTVRLLTRPPATAGATTDAAPYTLHLHPRQPMVAVDVVGAPPSRPACVARPNSWASLLRRRVGASPRSSRLGWG